MVTFPNRIDGFFEEFVQTVHEMLNICRIQVVSAPETDSRQNIGSVMSSMARLDVILGCFKFNELETLY